MKSRGFAVAHGHTWLLAMALGVVCWAPLALGQSTSQPDQWKPGTTVTELQDVNNIANPTRIVETRTEVGGRRIERRVTEARSINGGYAPISETEDESVRVDANTVRVVHRTYGRDASGNRQLLRVTEEEKSKLPSGGERVVRTSSNSDVDGRLQVVGREIQQTSVTGPDTKQTETTILLLTPNGFAPVQKNVEVEQRRGDQTDVRKTSFGVDVNGRLVPFAEKQSTSITRDGNRSTSERISADYGNGMSIVQVTTGKEQKDAQGQQHTESQTFTPAIPGITKGTDLYLDRQVSTVTRKLPDGSTRTEQQLQEAIPTSPRDGLRVQQSVTEVSQPTGAGKTDDRKTIQQWNGNQGLQTVMVGDTQHAEVVH